VHSTIAASATWLVSLQGAHHSRTAAAGSATMTGPEPLIRRVHGWHLSFSLVGGALLSWAVPFLLLLAEPVRTSVTVTLFVSMLTGGLLAGILIRFRLRKHHFLLRALSVESHGTGALSIAPEAIQNFIAEPQRIARAW